MKHSEFWALMEREFGTGYAHRVAGSHVLHALDDRTAEQALAAGVPPRRVWEAICVDFEVTTTFLDHKPPRP